MYKQVMLLGLLLERPMYGQQIREVIETHHDLFADSIKKPTIYYQLEKLANDGYLEIRRESVEAPGPGAAHEDMALRERDVYYITAAGRHYFSTLLRAMLRDFTPGMNSIDAGLFFLHHVTSQEAISLLQERSQLVEQARNQLIAQMEQHPLSDDAHKLVHDHKLALLDAELRWLEGTVTHLSEHKVASIQK
jgi:DNA-binding PadR family transcriptional regulator